ncbi:NmrA family NAD(P)-binding protein, partial [Mycobacterium sp. NPDC003449]
MFLVTGANGTVGSHVVAQLAEAGHEVRALVRDPRNGQSLLRDGVTLSVGDFADAASLDAALDGA